MKTQEQTTETILLPLVQLMRNYADYNLWANATLVHWLRKKPAELLEKEMPSSFSSVRATINHIWNGERYWLSVLKKEEAEERSKIDGTMENVFRALVEQSDALADCVIAMTNEEIIQNNVVIDPWFQCDFKNYEYIMQAINHSTYHRGQIITIGRSLGFTDAPMTDYNFYNIHGI